MTLPPPIPTPGTPSVGELLGYKEAEIAIDGSVLSNRSCVKCAYNLYGLQKTGNCPECGTSVAHSLKGHLLRFASEEYLRTLATGFSFILNGILATCILVTLMIVATVIIQVMSNATNATITIGTKVFTLPSNMNSDLVESIGYLVHAALGFIVFLGYMKVTSEDPGMTGLEYPRKARTALKVAVIFQIFASTTVLLLDLISKARSLGPALETASMGVEVIGAIAWVVQFFSMMHYCKWLVARIPDVALIQKIRNYSWQLPVIAILGSCLIGLGPLIALIMYWELLHKIRRHLREILRANHQPDLAQASAA